jgi:uncharacterized protein (UPF0548 family)
LGPAEGLTYRPIGATRGDLPEGFAKLRRTRRVGQGRDDFEAAAEAVMRWEAQRVLGVRVDAPERVTAGAELRAHLGLGPLAITAPARVVYVVDEPRRRGFAYGTLPGHPVSGEESFVVELLPDDTVLFTVSAYSRPARWFTRLAGPVGRSFQRVMAGRYLAAIRRATGRSR